MKNKVKKTKNKKQISKFHLIAIVSIFLVGFSIYFNSFNAEFLMDDEGLIEKNPYIRNFSYIPKVFSESLFAGVKKEFNCYRPIQLFTYIFDYHFYQLNPVGYHITNTILHILVAIFIYGLFNILFNNTLISLFTSLLFVSHPIHTEAITYISGRADSLMALFLLISFVLYIKYISSKKIYLYIFVLISYILSLLSKEMAMVLLLLIPIYHYTFNKKIKFTNYFPLLLVTFAYLFLRTKIIKLSPINPEQSTSFLQRVPGFFVAMTNYIKLLILPFNLHMEYGFILFKLGNPYAIIGILIFSLLIYLCIVFRRNKPVFFSISIFLLTLLPVSNLYPLNAYMAEHWLYIPSIGLFFLLSYFLVYIYKKIKSVGIGIFLILLIFYSSLTIKQNQYWKTAITFFERTLKFNPKNPNVHNNLGVAYMKKKLYDKAILEFKKAIEINPKNPNPYSNLSLVYNNKGMYNEAVVFAKKAIEIDPNFFEAYYNLGLSYYNMKKYDQACLQYEKTISINPHFSPAYYLLGIIYATEKKYDEAITNYKKAISINPTLAEAYNNLGVIYGEKGMHDKAIEYYKKAISINPTLAEAYNNLGNAYFIKGNFDEAIKYCKKAISMNPSWAEAYNRLGEIYASKNMHDEVIENCEKAVSINPNFAKAHHNLSIAYYYRKQYKLAIIHYDKFLKLGGSPIPELEQVLAPYRNGH